MRGPQAGWRPAAILTVGLTLIATPAITGSDTANAGPRAVGPLSPESGALLGAYAKPEGGWSESHVKSAVTGLESTIGRTLAIDHHYYPWGGSFPSWKEPWDLANDRIPMVTLGGSSAPEILTGSQDPYIRARADAAKSLGGSFFLRWFADMDLQPDAAGAPWQFINAWRRIHGIFQNRGAQNAVWVWCPSAAGFTDGSAASYYPGDAYVDWVCADGYNWAPGRANAPYAAFWDIFKGFHDWGSGRSKPMMVGETGVQEFAPGDKARWIDNARAVMKNNFKGIQAFVYSHANSSYDFRVTTSGASQTSFRNLSLDPYFAAGAGTPPPSSTGNTLFGAYVQPEDWTMSGVKSHINGLESYLGRTLDIDQHYYPWTSSFPGWKEAWDLEQGRIPLITWAGPDQGTSAIVNGWQDWRIRERADGVKALGEPVFIRWFAEADAAYHEEKAESPAKYIAAWRRIHNIFANRGATNVIWVWCGTAWGFTTGAAQSFYPGDAYVDWTCADGFNWAPNKPARTFAEVFADFYSWGKGKGKPMMIGEWATQEFGSGKKAQWIRAAGTTVQQQMPRIRAVVYFDSRTTDFSGTLYDWRVDSSAGAYGAFRDVASDPFFQPAHEEILSIHG